MQYYYLLFILFSNFFNYPNNALCRFFFFLNLGVNTESNIAFGCRVSLVSFNQEYSPANFIHDIDIFFVSRPVVGQNDSHFELPDCFHF